MLTRRNVLQRASLLAAGAAGITWPGCSQQQPTAKRPPRPLRIGMVTDVHYGDKESAKTRHYRASEAKLAEAVARFNELDADFVIELGDFIDAAESVEQETGWLRHIESIYARARCPRYHVLGNHCVQTLTKEQFLSCCKTPRSYYSFDTGGFHFIVLDACFREDGVPYGNNNFKWTDANIPPAELAWLHADAKATDRPTIAFVHQRLDMEDHHGVRNRADVRALLEASGRVLAVFQGHTHNNDLKQINGITYCTLPAMVEGDTNACALATIHANGAIHLDGFGRQESRDFGPPLPAATQ